MNHDASMAWHERARRVIPGGVNSNVRLNSVPCPLTYSHGHGSRIWDIDGNEYIDYVLGQGPMLLGHSPEPVMRAIREQSERGGLVFAGQCDAELHAAELIVEHVPCAEMVRFTTTGSEAVHAAIRLARAATGRNKIVRFEGHYHGWLDTIAWCPPRRDEDLGSRDDPRMRPASRGQCDEDAANLIVRPWNDSALMENVFAANGDAIAAVICDCFACASGLIPAKPEFLQCLRRLCDEHRAVLIFDEVITGFRVALGGAQAYYGVTPDLATFAKALGAGVPVAAVAGKRTLMEQFGNGPVVHAGTYNGNPLVMAATVAALQALSANGGAALECAHALGRMLWEGLAAIAHDAHLRLDIRGVPSVFSISFLPEDAEPVVDFRSSLQSDPAKLDRFWRAMQGRGVQFTTFGIWFLSAAHSEDDVHATLAAAAQAFHEL